jgi:hypothetical protein
MIMNIQAKFLINVSISAIINGAEPITIPDIPSNRHRAMIAEWEAEGNEITPYQTPVQPARRIGAFREFMDLFSDAEQLLIISATQVNVSIKRWYDKAVGGSSFSLDHSQTEEGLTALVAAGLLTQKRKSMVLATDFNA